MRGVNFVLDPKKMDRCPHCNGTCLVVEDVTWERDKDKMACAHAQCSTCGQEFLPIQVFMYWDYFVNGGKRPSR